MHNVNRLNALTYLVLTVALLSSPTLSDDAVPLKGLAQRYGFTATTETNSQVRWKSRYSTVVFNTGSRRLLFNNRLFWLNGPIEKNNKHWSISKTDADTVIKPLLQARSVLSGQGHSIVVLDPGHGGADPGAIGRTKVTEKKLVLDISKRVKRKLLSSNVAVRMTRSKDTTLTLEQRPKLASRWGGDVFVSIHANKASNETARGIETFALPAAGYASTTSNKANSNQYAGNKHNAANTALAGLIQQGILAHTDTPDRGVKRARFTVLRNATCPAALVEVGFLSNKTEAGLLGTSAYREKVAEGIAQGILTYLVKAEASQKP